MSESKEAVERMAAHGRILVFALSALATTASACGPDFPADLLSDRAGTLGNLPEGAFAFEAQRLVAAGQRFTLVERFDYGFAEQKITRESVERAWWGERYEKVVALRDQGSASAAFAASAGLPDEVRHYFAGAAAFAKDNLPAAAEHFHAVLQLPAPERPHYGLWAQYMLGRVAYAQQHYAEAEAAFAATRELVVQGAEDPLGIAATSLGDEARAHLDAGEDAAAIALYAQQASLGSLSGRESLLFVARAIVVDDARLSRDAADPLTQRLLVAYLFSRSGELSDEIAETTTPDGNPAPAPTPSKIVRFLAAVEKLGLDHVEGADRLAALAYRSGRFDIAEKLAPLDASGLAWWVRAKLALRAGDAAAAAQAYAQAAKAFPADEQWGTAQMMVYDPIKPQCRVEGEQGTLALSRGEYVRAMEHLYNAASQYWLDAAYVAERVLTLDELKTFVDAHAPKATPPGAKPTDDDERNYWLPALPAQALRTLLARRLLRAERFDEALNYFDAPQLHAKAQAYIDARHGAQSGDRIDKARAWYAAARIARSDGIDLLGYELDPDYQIYQGDFDLNGKSDADGNALLDRDDIAVAPQLAGKDEPARVAASRAQPLKRFHYRYNAVDFAQKSADFVNAKCNQKT